MSYVEFRLSVPVSDLGDDDSRDIAEVVALFALLGITPLPDSLEAQYDSYYDSTCWPGPHERINRGDVRIYRSDTDSKSFLSVDMFAEAIDQMNMVEICVCCRESLRADVHALLQAIRNRAEVASALLSGNLGIQEELSLQNFPRQIPSGGELMPQHVQVYCNATLERTSRFSLRT